MKKITLAAIVATGIAGGAVAVSQLDLMKTSGSVGQITTVIDTLRYRPVDLGKTVTKPELEKALSSAAQELGWRIDFKDFYKKEYKLGSVEEISEYLGSKASLRRGVSYRDGLDIEFFSFGRVADTKFFITYSDMPEEDITKYLKAVSTHLYTQ